MVVGFSQTAPQRSLVGIVRPAVPRHLIVCFNGYGRKAFARPDLPFETAVSAYEKLSCYDAHIIWFAEAQETWYLDQQDRIVDKITSYIVDNGIETVKLFGGSAGGYAALRIGALVDRALHGHRQDAMLMSFSLNPQTGFRKELIERVRSAAAGTAFQHDFGRNPVMLSRARFERYHHLRIDLSEFLSDYTSRNFAAVVMSDVLNPIEKAFCADLPQRDDIMFVPHFFGLKHTDGGTRIFNEGKLWELFDAVVPFARGEAGKAAAMALLDEA